MVISCAAYNCTNRCKKGIGLSFHNFPHRNPKLLKKWIRATKRKNFTPTKNSKLCSKHFTEDCYQIRPNSSYPLLTDEAIPTLFDFPSNLSVPVPKKRRIIVKHDIPKEDDPSFTSPDGQQSIHTPSTSSYVDNSSLNVISQQDSYSARMVTIPNTTVPSPTKTKLRREIKILKQRLKRRDNKIKSMTDLIYTLKKKEKEQLIADWEPEPLVEPVPPHHPALKTKIVHGKVGKYVNIDGITCLNFASHNYLSFVENKTIEESAINSLQKYGVGSCGPRGFYGTIDVHLELEKRLAKFMEMEEAVLYSYGFPTIASAIPSYSKKGDIIFVDEKVNFAIQKGLDASRSRIFYFKHNDVNDLERLLEQQAQLDKKNPKKAAKTRRFLVVEGIYMKTGTICSLPELIELRKRYKLRIFIDESISFGSIGKTGRGVTEYFNIRRNEVDLIIGSMENSLASIGGFCVGSSFIVEHQILSGLGYCFSASLPPLLASAAIAALDILENTPSLLESLANRSQELHDALEESEIINIYFHIPSHRDSPVKILELKDSSKPYLQQVNILNKIVDSCIQNEIAVITSAYLEETEKFLPVASLRITANVKLEPNDIKQLISALQRSCSSVFAS